MVYSYSIFANPTPLGFEIGKTKIADVKARIDIEKGTDICEGLQTYSCYKNLNNLGLDGLRTANFTFDKKGVLQSVNLLLESNQYNSVFNSLANKYKLFHQSNNHLGKAALFVDGNCSIGLNSPPNTEVIGLQYISKTIEPLIKKCFQKSSEKPNKLL